MWSGLICQRPSMVPELARIVALARCTLPEDDFPETNDGCPECQTRMSCDREGHGHYHVGLHERGFRTDRCPATWSGSPFAWGVQEAFGWSEKAGGAFSAVYGADPPAVLLRAVAFYGNEYNARSIDDMERTRPKT